MNKKDEKKALVVALSISKELDELDDEILVMATISTAIDHWLKKREASVKMADAFYKAIADVAVIKHSHVGLI